MSLASKAYLSDITVRNISEEIGGEKQLA